MVDTLLGDEIVRIVDKTSPLEYLYLDILPTGLPVLLVIVLHVGEAVVPHW